LRKEACILQVKSLFISFIKTLCEFILHSAVMKETRATVTLQQAVTHQKVSVKNEDGLAPRSINNSGEGAGFIYTGSAANHAKVCEVQWTWAS
jgi:hypothetical protein